MNTTTTTTRRAITTRRTATGPRALPMLASEDHPRSLSLGEAGNHLGMRLGGRW